MLDWLPTDISAEDQALENMFHYYLSNKTGAKNLNEFYRQNGVRVKDNQIIFDSPQHRTLFLLRWS